jgi:molecular chaperone DnaK
MGAAVQGGILAGESSDILLLDVTPLNLGIRTLGDVMTTIVEANSTIPIDREQVFSTAADNQSSVEIEVLQGNRPMANDNKSLGKFFLDGIAPAPRGIPQIEVKFSISADGLLEVKATDKATGKEQHIRVESKTGLTDADIERMRAEAKEHEEEDKRKKEEADKINSADSLLFQTEKALKDAGDKITDEEKKPVEDALSNLRNALVEKKYDDLDNLTKAVTDAWYPLATKIYQGGASGNTQNPFEGSNPGA